MDVFTMIAEQRIREAIEKGDFDDLEGFGKPVDNTEYFSVPEEDRMFCHILKNTGVVPQEVVLNKKAVEISQKISKTRDSKEAARLKLELSQLMTQISVLTEGRRR
jgi:hypothetical protein